MPRIIIEGINLYYDTIGNGPNPLLLLPGFLGTVEDDFEPMIEKLDKELFTIVSWDPVGYGRSYPPAREVSSNMYPKDAALLGEMMKKLGYDRYHIFGWSGGGHAGILLAAMYPDRVITLTTFATATIYEEKNLRLYQAMARVEYWREDRLQLKMKHLGMDYLKEVCAQLCVLFHASLRQRLGLTKADVKPIKCPSLIMHGEKDNYVDVNSAHYLHTLMPGARFCIFPSGGHDYHLTNTDEVLKCWLEFVLKHMT